MSDIHSFEPLWGTWKIDKLLGSGSYGSVYKAVRREYGQEYWAAIKHVSIPMSEAELQTVYDEGWASDERSAQMYYEQLLDNLQEEIQFMYRLKGNTNIVAYEDHLTVPKQDMPGYDIFIRMELLRGLNDIVRADLLTTAEICRLGIDICKALELLEREGIVHRDIKPANILRNSKGNYKLGDFGVAKQLEHTHTIMSKKGTYTYMAPEVFKGETASARADIYSLGLVMHRLLNNNKAPFIPVDATHISHTQSEEALMRRMKGDVLPAPVMADAALAEIIGIACAYKPEERFQTAEAFHMALEGYYKNELCSDQPVIVDVPEQKRPENIVEEPHNGEEETPRMIDPTEKLFGGDTTKGGTKPEPVPEPEREYHSDEDGETEADEPVDKPSSLVKRILIGAAAVAAVCLIFAFPKEREVNTGEENTVVNLEAEDSAALVTPVLTPELTHKLVDMTDEMIRDNDFTLTKENLKEMNLSVAETVETLWGGNWPMAATMAFSLEKVPVYAKHTDTETSEYLTNGDNIVIWGAYVANEKEEREVEGDIFYRISYTNSDYNSVKSGYICHSEMFGDDYMLRYKPKFVGNMKQSVQTTNIYGEAVDLTQTCKKADFTILYQICNRWDEHGPCESCVLQLNSLLKAAEEYSGKIQVIALMYVDDNAYATKMQRKEWALETIQYLRPNVECWMSSERFLKKILHLDPTYSTCPQMLVCNNEGELISNLFNNFQWTNDRQQPNSVYVDYSKLLRGLVTDQWDENVKKVYEKSTKSAAYVYRTNTEHAVIKTAADHYAEDMVWLEKYEKVDVIVLDENDWAEVNYKGFKGYIHRTYIEKMADTIMFVPARTNSEGVHLRAEPSTDAEIIMNVVAGFRVNIISDVGNGWSMVEAPNVNKIFYVSSHYLSKG